MTHYCTPLGQRTGLCPQFTALAGGSPSRPDESSAPASVPVGSSSIVLLVQELTARDALSLVKGGPMQDDTPLSLADVLALAGDLAAADSSLHAPERHPQPGGTATPERTRIAALDGGSTNGVQTSRLPPGRYRVFSGWDSFYVTVEG